MDLKFTVYGRPQPQGSTRAFIPKGWDRPVITTDNTKLKPWRQDVAQSALVALECAGPTNDAVAVVCRFYFLKPKSAGRRVTEKITKPDIDKLLRGLLDALTGIAFRDDAQVVRCECSKQFTDSRERAEIEVATYSSAPALLSL